MKQGAQIMDNAFCGGDSPQAPKVANVMDGRVAAIILMGNPRHVDGLEYNVGTATEGGVRFPYLAYPLLLPAFHPIAISHSH